MIPDDPKGSVNSDGSDFSAAGIDELTYRPNGSYIGEYLDFDAASFRKRLEPFAYNPQFKNYLYQKLLVEATLVQSHLALLLLHGIEKHPTRLTEKRDSSFFGLRYELQEGVVVTPNSRKQGKLLAKFWKELFDKRDLGTCPEALDLTNIGNV